jgi:hypothetical protein
MNVTKIVEKHVDSLFKTMKGLVKRGIYRNPTHGTDANYRATVAYSDTPIQCIVTTYRLKEIELGGGRIASEDRKILIPLKGLTVDIQLGGEISIDNTDYGVHNVEKDPTGTLAIVQARL